MRPIRTPKINVSKAVLGAALVATAFGAHVSADASATTSNTQPQAVQPIKAQTQVKASATQVLAVAKAQVGTSENASGGGTKFQQWYANSQRAAETVQRDGGSREDYLNAAWCSMFVSWVGEQTGARPQVGWDAYTVTHAKWFAANDRWGQEAKPGAVVFFSWSGSKDLSSIDHVGFVVKDNGDGTISTIEGNTGNGKVEERVRPTSQVAGYGYPSYAA
ncbi:C40 family peptidase [Nonomuraea sp. SBT364]|uniref:C40 family peptidase n=1 Tax=Nonomuraea sp. SBT364 TaxID=1580530 RepID=UPI00066AF6FD|nr:CHAP domain-containing protein [Nonomuraea sp. SBT364]